jgi:hypothetical protein
MAQNAIINMETGKEFLASKATAAVEAVRALPTQANQAAEQGKQLVESFVERPLETTVDVIVAVQDYNNQMRSDAIETTARVLTAPVTTPVIAAGIILAETDETARYYSEQAYENLEAQVELGAEFSGVVGTVRGVKAAKGAFDALDEVGEAVQEQIGRKASKGGGKQLWSSWDNYAKVTRGGREYAQVGDRLYTRHAVNRMQPSGLGAPAGELGAGRSISPNFIEDVISTGSARKVTVDGVERTIHTSGSVQVVTEGDIVVTVNPWGTP